VTAHVSASASPPVEGFDPLAQDFIANPDPVLERARRDAPVFYYPPLGVWVITRYEDVRAVARDYETFSSRAFRTIPPPPEFRALVPPNLLEPAFVNIDPPRHTVVRKNANKAFTPKRVAEMEPVIQEIADELIDSFAANGHCDLMQQYCYPLSLRVIVRMLGLPESGMRLFRQWTEDLFAVMSPGAADDPTAGEARPMPEAELRERWSRVAEAYAYYKRFVEERRANPKDDLTSAMIAARNDDGTPAMSADAVICHMIELTAAGNDTTANLMANAVMFFDKHREQFEEVKRDPSLLANAIEEALRRRPTSPHMYRITTRDVTVAGVTIPARSLVCLSYGSGSNDEAQFSDSHRFDIHRENANDHLAFGHGRHFCLGAPLARLEARIGLETLFRRLPDIRVPQQTLEFVPVVTLQTLISLRVEWD
jgi:cytochrome P450